MDNRALWAVPAALLAVLVTVQAGGGDASGTDGIIARYPASVTVTAPGPDATVGINGSGNALAFGTVPRGAVVTRRITLQHDGRGTVQPSITADGRIAPAITATPADITLPPSTERNITVALNTSRLAPGTYSGRVTVSR